MQLFSSKLVKLAKQGATATSLFCDVCANVELPSRENAAAELFQSKLEYHPMVWPFYAFLMVFGRQWSPVAQRRKLQAVVTQTALVSRIKTLQFLVFLNENCW